MLKKQLLTLAAIVGILACGACFAPSRYTPPPPPPIAVEGLKNLRVVVRDGTGSARLNPAALAAVIVQNFNYRFHNNGLSAHLAEQPGDDGIAEVKIVSVTAARNPDVVANGEQSWKFEVKTVVSLTRSNGQVLWQGAEATDSPQLNSYATEEEEMWRDPFVQSQLLRAVGGRVVHTVAFQAPLTRPNGP
jgi:hypothetical protein